MLNTVLQPAGTKQTISKERMSYTHLGTSCSLCIMFFSSLAMPLYMHSKLALVIEHVLKQTHDLGHIVNSFLSLPMGRKSHEMNIQFYGVTAQQPAVLLSEVARK